MFNLICTEYKQKFVKKLNFLFYQVVYLCVYLPYHLHQLCFHGKLLFAGMAMATLPHREFVQVDKLTLPYEIEC